MRSDTWALAALAGALSSRLFDAGVGDDPSLRTAPWRTRRRWLIRHFDEDVSMRIEAMTWSQLETAAASGGRDLK
jgi:hypothetical protein